MPVLQSEHERRDAFHGSKLPRSALEQQRNGCPVPILDGRVQRRRAVGSLRVLC